MRPIKLLIALLFLSSSIAAQNVAPPSLVKDLCKTCPNNIVLEGTGMTVFKNKLIFGLIADSSIKGVRKNGIWEYDGNTPPQLLDGSSMIEPTRRSLPLPELLNSGDTILYYLGQDTANKRSQGIYQLDGVAAPSLEKLLYTTPKDWTLGFAQLDSLLFFTGDIPGNSIYFNFIRYNTNTKSLKQFPLYNQSNKHRQDGIYNIVPYKGMAYFHGGPSDSSALYAYNPSTDTIDVVWKGVAKSIMIHKDTMYFIGYTTYNTWSYGAIYKYYGNGNPVKIVDSTAFATGISALIGGVNDLIFYNDKLYFWGYVDGLHKDYRLLAFNPLNSKVEVVSGINTVNSSMYLARNLYTVFNNKLFFRIEHTVYTYNGSKVDTLAPRNFHALSMKEYKGALYMIGTTPTHGCELYKYNDSSLSIEVVNRSVNATLYPNPTDNDATIKINIEKPTTITTYIMDIYGKLVYEGKSTEYAAGDNSIVLPTKLLQSQNYIITLKAKGGNTIWSSILTKQ